MKLLNFLTTLLFLIFVSGIVNAQELIYSGIEGRLTEAQSSEIQNADGNIKRAEKSIDGAEAVEAKYESLKKSNKEKKRKKFDKKTYEAKKLRIGAEKKYQKAYEGVINVYSAIITESKYYYPEDKEKANSLNEEAKSLLKDAKDKMMRYNKIQNDTKELKKVRAKNLSSAISKSRSLKEESLQKQFSALEILLSQDKKKRAAEEDRLAWENALEANTIEAYEEYIDSFSSGKFISEARRNIANLNAIKQEEQKEKENTTTQQNSGYVFKVQIAASKFPLSKTKLSRSYADVSKIERTYAKRYYKYRVGRFSTYKEAYQLKSSLLSRVPGAFIVVYDKDGKQIKVTDEMKR